MPDSSPPAWNDSLLLRAARRQPVPRTPIWLMRQAGRYLPEYRALRQKLGFLELCKTPDLCAEIMLATVERLGVDAAIFFSDLLLILEPMGLGLGFPQRRRAAAGQSHPHGRRRRPPAGTGDAWSRWRSWSRPCGRPGPACSRRAADRLCRGPVHPGRLCRRRRIAAATTGTPRA